MRNYNNVKKKKELADLVLRESIQNHRRRDIRDLRGKIKLDPNYNHKKLREKM